MNFVPTASLGIIALSTNNNSLWDFYRRLGQTPLSCPLILKELLAIVHLPTAYELMDALDKMSQPDPQAQQLQQAQQQLALQAAQAQIAVSTTQAEQNRADATKTMIEAQLLPQEVQAKVT